MLVEKYNDRIDKIFGKYPDKRSAVMALLYIAQEEYGHITNEAIQEIGGILGLDATHIKGLIGFYTMYYDRPRGRYLLQVCTDLPCALRGAETFAGKVCENLGVKLGETTPDGMITVEAVMCLAGCDHAPMFQVQDADGIHYHEDQTVDSALQVVEGLRRRAAEGGA